LTKEMGSKNYAGDPLLEEAGENLRRFNLCTDKPNRGAALAVILATPLLTASQNGQGRPDPVAVLENASNRLLSSFGRIDPTWGEVNRLRRGVLDRPLSGGPDTLRNILFDRQRRDGTQTALAGDQLAMFSTWARDGRWQIESISTYGQSQVP